MLSSQWATSTMKITNGRSLMIMSKLLENLKKLLEL